MRKYYARDLAFRAPPKSYSYDSRHGVYFRVTQLVVPQFDILRRQILLWHHNDPWHAHTVQWSEDKIKADPFFGRSRVRFRVPP